MALGGGIFLVQNKKLPGFYMNVISAARASATLSDRGTATMPVTLSWGPDNEIFTVTNGEFQKDSLKIFGYSYTDDAIKPLRELFANALTVHFYKLNGGGEKAQNTLATAKYTGTRGNEIKIVIEQNENFEEESNEIYDVSTYFGLICVDVQTVQAMAELKNNDYVTFKQSAVIDVTAGMPLSGGTDGTTTDAAYQFYLDKIEAYSFNTMGCSSQNDIVKSLFAAFTKRMRDENGVKFQTVLHRYTKGDYEGIISVENGLVDHEEDASLVYWVTGAQAGCAVNKSLTNTTYNGEYAVDTSYTQAKLSAAIDEGKFIFHKVGDEVNVLRDINTFTDITVDKNEDFCSNQTVRVLDQIGNDIAVLFNTKYLGKVPNDNAGRVSLWADIVKHHEQLQDIRAIQEFTDKDIEIAPGDKKNSVVVTDNITPVNAMEQLYMTVYVH